MSGFEPGALKSGAISEGEDDGYARSAALVPQTLFVVCGCTWEDEWDCLCNDRCPECNKEIEPDSWEEADLDPDEIRRRVS